MIKTSFKHFILILFFLFFLTACGETEGRPELGINGYVYQSRQIPINGKYWIEKLKVKDNSLYFITDGSIYSLPIEDNMSFDNREYLVNASGLTDYCIGQDGMLYYVTIQFKMTKDWQYVPVGCTLVQKAGDSAKGWNKLFDINISMNGNCLAIDGNGQLFLLSEDALYQINGSGEIEDTIAIENYRFPDGDQQLVTGSEGRVYYCTSRSQYGSSDEAWGIYEITGVKDSSLKEIPKRIGKPYSSAYGLLCDSSDGIVYQYKEKSASWEPIFRWGDSCLNSARTNSNELVQADEDNFSALLWDVLSDDYSLNLYQLTKTDVSEFPEKEVLVLASAGYTSDELKQWVSRFNMENEKYHITIEHYEWNEIDTRLNSRLVSSNPPDLVDVNGLDVVSYAKKQTFEDLSPFLEASDILNKDLFFDRLLDAYTIDGKLICIPNGFYIDTVFGRTSEVGNKIGWTAEDVMTLADQYPDRWLLAIGSDFLVSRLFGTYLCEHYIDWESGECSFESEEFCCFLEWLKAYLDRIQGKGYTYKYLSEDCLLYMYSITGLSSRARYERELGELTFIGHPTSDGRPYIPAEAKDTLSILSRSKHKEGAWEFLEYFLSQEGRGYFYFPSRQDIFQRKLEEEMTPDYIYTEDGEIEMMDGWVDREGNILSGPRMKVKCWANTEEVLYYYMSQEQADAVLEIFDVLDFTPQGGAKSIVLDIFDEESAAYLAGSRSAEETAKIIQNRVKNLVQENL